MAFLGPDDLARLAVPEWGDAVRAVPREHFIPDTALVTPMGGAPSYWIDRTTNDDAWWETVYSDTTILTQIDDGVTELTEESAATSATPLIVKYRPQPRC